MPAMPRFPGKPRKIALALLGARLHAKKSARDLKLERRLLFEETARSR